MSSNKFNFINFFLITLLFIILPVFFVFYGCVYYNILKIKTNDINIEIKKELQNKTISEKEIELNTLKESINKQIDKNTDYNKYINDLSKEIIDTRKKKEELALNIDNKKYTQQQLENQKNILQKNLMNYLVIK